MTKKTCETCINYTVGDGLCRKFGIAKGNLVCDFYGKNLRDARNLFALLKELTEEKGDKHDQRDDN